MTTDPTNLPEVTVGLALTDALRDASMAYGIEGLEQRAQGMDFEGIDLLGRSDWLTFSDQAQRAYRGQDHVIVRGLPVTEDGAALLLAALAMSQRFRTYRGHQIVKKFSMSPWTQDLSHTTREGDFHTDLNTDPEPPALTAIQCLEPDPGASQYGQNRVARSCDLVAWLEVAKHQDVLRFLRRVKVAMTNGRNQRWSGTIVEGDYLRYHPATLRSAQQSPEVSAELEHMIRTIHEAGLAVSTPFDLGPGDVLFVSNHRALHYRSECSVSFTRFPTEYQARAIFVLHQSDEPQ